MCTWSSPDEATHNQYMVSYYSLNCTSGDEAVIHLNLKANVFEISIDLFSSATAYACSIAAGNSAGIGPSSTISVTTEGITFPQLN